VTHRRPIPLVLALFLAGGLTVVAAALTLGNAAGTVSAYEAGAALLGAIAAAALALATRPAWPLSIGLALGVFSNHWSTLGIPIAFDRLLISAAVVSILVREALRRPGALRTRPIDWLLIVVALYAVCSALVVGTLGEHSAMFALIDRLSVLGFALFYVAPRAFREPRDRQVLLGTFVALGAYLGVTALLETTGPRALVVPSYISDPSIGIHYGRARGPFVESSEDGLVLFACGIASVLAALSWHSRRWRRVALVIAGLCALGTLLTLTRAVWISSVAATALALLATRETRRFVAPVGALVALMVLVAFAAVPHLQAQAQSRANDQAPLWDRQNSNAAALRMIAARPLVGFGWGEFPTQSISYYRQSPNYPLTFVHDVHNVYLVNAVELGLIGGGLWLLAFATVIVGGVLRRGPPSLRPWKLALIALGTSYAMTALVTPLAFALPTLLVWTWSGLAWGEDGPRLRQE